ncbi:uncharacterized protein LOC109840263 [Asparagus officinalis]|uniref:uncharacterized protein LOC109840263 n=1 Tax=Asparagus officinalis TaxID=4686 RepID=UPI00098E563E|nr:uncharacterized protein LOC109840263 [Asparagus officinalis]
MVREELISSDFKVNSPILKFPSLDPWWGSTSKKIKVGKDFEEQRDAMLSEYFYMELYQYLICVVLIYAKLLGHSFHICIYLFRHVLNYVLTCTQLYNAYLI